MQADAPTVPRFTLGNQPAGARHIRKAVTVVLVCAFATAALLPVAADPGPVLPGFVLFHQTALVAAYGIGAWVLYSQYHRAPSVNLLLAGAGTLFTAAIVALQLLSLPGVFSPPATRLLGPSAETTTWLWTFWHLGPPASALAYGLAHRHVGAPRLGKRWLPPMLASVIGACALAVACAGASTSLLGRLPRQSVGDDYSLIVTSGVGPALEVFTLIAIVIVFRNSRGRRSILDVWILASLVLLLLDNALTLIGGTRSSIGWYAGRAVALVSAFAVLWAYLYEVTALQDAADRVAEQLWLTEAKLRHSQKMEAVGQLTGGVAHEFNNLLMIITSKFDSIARLRFDDAKTAGLAASGLQAADRGARLTRQLLSFARRQPLHFEIMNVNQHLMQFSQMAEQAVGMHAQLRFLLGATVHPVNLDPAEFQGAILNLLVNARDAMGARGGTVVIATRNDTVSATGHGAMAAGEYVVVAVSDDGPGMSPEVAAQAFEPFFTTKAFGQSAGLGLSQVYGFAGAAGGEAMIVERGDQPGATVEMWLPRAMFSAAKRTSENWAQETPPHRRGVRDETVLVVEDEPEVMSVVSDSLAELGYEVLVAHDAVEAVARLREDRRIDILFTDIVMPGAMNGVQLGREAQRLRPRLRILLTSGYADAALVNDFDLPPTFDVLAKPYRLDDLARRLDAA